ncbi:MAG: GcrA family cell cycle regulator [Rhodoblastus sp.]
MSWTDERVELLRKLWLEGLSASQIASELSNGITRNAVIGKVHRLGLSGRAKAPGQTAPRPRAAKPIRTPSSSAPRTHVPIMRGNLAYALTSRVVEAPPRPRAQLEEVVIPMSERVTIMELRESTCRWPLGDPSSPDFRYCGADSPIGEGPYCTYHARIAYQPAQVRRRAR